MGGVNGLDGSASAASSRRTPSNGPSPQAAKVAAKSGPARGSPAPAKKKPIDPQKSADARRAFLASVGGAKAERYAPAGTGFRPAHEELPQVATALSGAVGGVVDYVKSGARGIYEVFHPFNEQSLRSLDDGEKIAIGNKGTHIIQTPNKSVRVGGQVENGTEIEKKGSKYVLHNRLGTEAIVDLPGNVKPQGGVKIKTEYTFETEQEALDANERLGRILTKNTLAETRELTPAEQAQNDNDTRFLAKYRTATELSGSGAVEIAKSMKVVEAVEIERSGKGQVDVVVRVERAPPKVQVRLDTSFEEKRTPQVAGGPVSVNAGGASAKITTSRVITMDVPPGTRKSFESDPLRTLSSTVPQMAKSARTETRVKIETQDPTGRRGTDTEVTLRPTGDAKKDAELQRMAERGDLDALKREGKSNVEPPFEYKHESWKKEGTLVRYKVDIGIYEQEMDFEIAKKRIVAKEEYPAKN